MTKYNWIHFRWGVERVKIEDGSIVAKSLKEAKRKIIKDLGIYDWGSWVKDTIVTDDFSARCVTIEKIVSGKNETISLWKDGSEYE